MMRSLYSAVSGLKTHQTKMDVIGNNISNVNTVAFKSSSVTFSSIMYQTLSGASGANETTGTGGINAKQIGLGVTTGSTTASITTAGAAETTGRPFDLKITDQSTSSFFIVNNGSSNVFTKAGSFYVDGTGNLCMTSTGYTVMGWQVDPTTGDIKKDIVSALRIMSAGNQTSAPEATEKATCAGVIDNNSTQVNTAAGYPMNLTVYDNLGYPYTCRFAIQAVDTLEGKYSVNLTDIMDSKGNSILTSDISLAGLFGTGNSNSTQGSQVSITDNYTFNPGFSKADLKSAITSISNEYDPADPTKVVGKMYTYYIDAQDVNDQLGLTGGSALPDGYKVKFTSANSSFNEAKNDFLTDGKTISIVNTSGLAIIEGTVHIDDTGTCTNTTVDLVYTKESGMDPAKDVVPYGVDGSLIKKVSIADYTDLGLQITSDDGQYVGYMFSGDNLEALKEALNITDKSDAYSSNSTIFYWPDLETLTSDILYDQMTFKGGDAINYVIGNSTTVVPLGPIEYTYSVENIMEDYAYALMGGKDLKDATDGKYPFTEELPSDAEIHYNMFTGNYDIVTPANEGFTLQFNTTDGTLDYVGANGSKTQTLNLSQLTRAGYDGFSDVTIDFSDLLNYNNNGASTAAMDKGDAKGADAGKKLGTMTGLTVDTTGKIFGSYDNGNTVLLGQIAVAQFSNAAGLEALGDNCYGTTLNSGDFNGIGVEISADGSSISTGELEMSNVDLSGEFTSMITTQRGFQANSRVITVSDSMLEELINLKR